MSKLRLSRVGAGCRGRVLLTSAMRISNFVSKFLIAELTSESWIRLQTTVPLPASGVWFASAEAKASFKKTARTITTRNLYADCILKFHVSLRWWNELYGQASRRYAHFMTRHHRQNEKIFLNCLEIVWHTEGIIISIQENLLRRRIGIPFVGQFCLGIRLLWSLLSVYCFWHIQQLFTGVEVNSGGYLPNREVAR